MTEFEYTSTLIWLVVTMLIHWLLLRFWERVPKRNVNTTKNLTILLLHGLALTFSYALLSSFAVFFIVYYRVFAQSSQFLLAWIIGLGSLFTILLLAHVSIWTATRKTSLEIYKNLSNGNRVILKRDYRTSRGEVVPGNTVFLVEDSFSGISLRYYKPKDSNFTYIDLDEHEMLTLLQRTRGGFKHKKMVLQPGQS